MKKDELLKGIAETGYNVGFGAKKHFATFDIVDKTNGRIGLMSIAIGIFSLVFEVLSHKILSASIATLGVIGLYTLAYEKDKQTYCDIGKQLNEIFLALGLLYLRVKSEDKEENLIIYEYELLNHRKKYNQIGLSKQIFLSDWYAHYKFFQQTQIEWIDEQKSFTYRDKIPLSARVTILIGIIFSLFLIIWLSCQFSMPECLRFL